MLRSEDARFVSRARCSVLGSALCAARAQAPISRSAASQNRDPGFLRVASTGAPALQRTAPRRATRCAASGARKAVKAAVHENVNVYLSPHFPTVLWFTRPVHEGALLEAILKWDRAKAWPGRGNPSRSDAASAAVPRKRRLGG